MKGEQKMENRIRKLEDQKTFLLAGNAILTVMRMDTKNRFTYRISQLEQKPIYFVSVLSGPNNNEDYSYIGTLFLENREFRHTKKSKVSQEASSFKTFQYLWNKLNAEGLSELVGFFHSGKCGRCARTLTVPESIERGIGPECAKLIGIREEGGESK